MKTGQASGKVNCVPKDQKPKKHRKLKVGLTLAVVAAVVLAALWQNYWCRHKILRAVTKIESATYFLLPDGEPSASSQTIFLHRGTTDASKPNSAAGLNSVPDGTAIEIDVCFTNDLVPFLSHGDDFDGATPQGFDFEDLESSDINMRSDGEPFLSFEEFLAGHAYRFPQIVLDVKSSHANANEKATKLAALIEKDLNRYLVTSLSGVVLTQLQDHLPSLRVGCETYGPLASWLAGFDGYHSSLDSSSAAKNTAAVGLGLRRLYFGKRISESEFDAEGFIADELEPRTDDD